MTAAHVTIAVGGIDTDVGKSYVTGLFARYLIQQGHKVTTLKLVQTGCAETSDDIRLHRQLMGQPLSAFDRDGTTCPYVFPYPASPLLSARMVGRVIEAQVLDRAMATLQEHHDWLLVEGAGGLLVPLNPELLLLDYFAARQLPMLLVCSPRLGSINHTRLSLEAIKARRIPLLGLVYNLFGNHPREIVQDTLLECRKALRDYGFAETLVIVPDARESTSAAWQTLVTAAQQLRS
ncbi:dethiobiotin synthase [Desulfobulbus propionicus DSM 2032]|jgi:dethiobiotin synthetase|uniref:ATP-dependent dethiobiotin synthetase BioD n=1 Tax=Desulfobulbus propionicus (strain ATCC 33891 / DSM 2032 / VKM B-1956 / 1pr3) TaxID=577650 RepID=A0A7U4DMH1_DESPD|nr:dethiobiotin synthase [Desulfobulbus propionicus]ADW16201.1 dethiobiotin synthase [Desulfobulbus propionicus DSM 2032]